MHPAHVGPLANLCDILPRERWVVRRVHDKDLPVPNNHRGISAVPKRVLDGVHAIRQQGDLSLIGSGKQGSDEKKQGRE